MLKVIHTPLLPHHTTHSSLLLAPLVTHTHARVIKEWETRTEPRNLGMKTDKRIIIRKAAKETLETILQTVNANDSRLMLQRRETLSNHLQVCWPRVEPTVSSAQTRERERKRKTTTNTCSPFEPSRETQEP